MSETVGFDGVAGAELLALDDWVLEYFKTSAKRFFVTIDRWRGQFGEKWSGAKGFKAPALFIAQVGSAREFTTKGGNLYPPVRFSMIVVTKNGRQGDLGHQPDVKDRHRAAIALSSIILRLIHEMEPSSEQCWGGPDRVAWRFENSTKLEDKGMSIIHFVWEHKLEVGRLDLDKLDDFATLFGEIFPDSDINPNPDLLPVEGQVDLPTS